MLGKVLANRYRIESLLGEGGMGAVYAGIDLTNNARVAVKMMLSPDLSFNRAMTTRFEREARAASSVDTDHIVKVLDFGTDPELGAPFMVLEFLVGSDVEKAVQKHGPLPSSSALRIVAQASVGLARAHDRGIIHRDIKAANLYLHETGGGGLTVKVLDFGIAKVLLDDLGEGGPAALTRTGAMLGSPLYMSPEQAQTPKNVDHRTDIWSLGIVLYEALSGKTPFGHAESIGQLIYLICSQVPEPVERSAPWVPSEVASIVGRCLRQDREERFPSTRALAAAIGQVLGGNEFSLRESDLRPLDAGSRGPTPSVQPSGTLVMPSTAPQGPASGVAAASAMPTPIATEPPAAGGGTADGLAKTTSRGGGKRASGLWVLAGIGAVAAVGAAFLTRSPGVRDDAASTATAVASEIPAERSFRLAVGPAGVSASVEGRQLPVVDGAVILTGTPGKTLRVTLRLDQQEIVRDVALTELGPLPASIAIERPPANAATTAPAPAAGTAPAVKVRPRKQDAAPAPASAPATPATKAAAPPAAADKLQEKFE